MKTAYVFTKTDFDRFRNLEKVLHHLETLQKAFNGNTPFLEEDIQILIEVINDEMAHAEGRVDR